MSRIRLDLLLVKRGLVPSRERAQAIIMAGGVRVEGRAAAKPGQLIRPEAAIEVVAAEAPYVSRAGAKLAHALDHFQVPVEDRICLDAGASTGGFTDCLLQRGARRVYAIDVGRGQLAWKIAQDPRVVRRDRTNLRYLQASDLPESIALATLDLAFISLTKVLVAVDRLLTPGGRVLALIKPQFEVGRGEVGKGGVVRDPVLHARAIASVRTAAEQIGWRCDGVVPSPITGADGNVEFLASFAKT